MPNLKDLKNQINSVGSTKKITSAMKMVAASKLRRSQEKAEAARPYSSRLEEMLSSLASSSISGEGIIKLLTGTGKQDKYLIENKLLSLYDYHSDGSGVCFSSRLRPIVSLRPKYNNQFLCSGKGSPHQFIDDLHLINWLETKSYQYDVITDEDLHFEGLELIEDYKVIITGSHPEYWSESMLNAVEKYLENGGKIMYLGGNGFYWVTSVFPDSPHVIEVRRWISF